MRTQGILALLALTLLGCKDREKQELHRTVERQASQIRRAEQSLEEVRGHLDEAERTLALLQSEAFRPVNVHERTATAREALRKAQTELRSARQALHP